MIRVLTHWNDLDKVSRVMENPDTFNVFSGQLVDININGKISALATDGTNPSNPVFLLNSVTDSEYESHDTAAGRVTTVEGNGVRITGDTDVVLAGTYNAGDELVADTTSDNNGKIKGVPGDPGTYTVVAKVISTEGDNVTFRTVEPYTVTVS